MSTLAVVAVLLLAALIPAEIARRKRLGFWTFYLFGVLLWIAAVPVALLLKDRRRRCPACAEVIRDEAVRCPHCQVEISAITATA